MSRTQTMHVRLERCDKDVSSFFDQETEGMDEYDLADYCFDKNIYKANGNWWEEAYKEELDEYGFTKVLSKDQSSVEFITQFYNGGTCLPEIIEGVLDGTK